MKNVFRSLIGDDRGLTAVEYSILAAVVALVMAAGAKVLGTSLSLMFATTVSNSL